MNVGKAERNQNKQSRTAPLNVAGIYRIAVMAHLKGSTALVTKHFWEKGWPRKDCPIAWILM